MFGIELTSTVATANLGLNLTSWLSKISIIILVCLHQLDKLRAHRSTLKDIKSRLTGVCFSVQIVLAELEAAKLQVTTLKAQLITSHEAADSARAASDSLAQMKTSLDTELSKAVQQLDAAKAEVQHLQCLLANTQADAQSKAANLQLLLENSQAKAASAEQEMNRLEQQLAGSQTAAAQQEEELKKVHQKELQAEVQAACITLLLPYCACLPRPTNLHLLNCSV